MQFKIIIIDGADQYSWRHDELIKLLTDGWRIHDKTLAGGRYILFILERSSF